MRHYRFERFIMIQTAWNYQNESDLPIHDYHLLVWEKGLSVIGYSTDGVVAECKTYIFTELWSFEEGKAVLHDAGILSHTQKVSHIWMTAPKHLIIPESLYEKGYANQWIRRFHFLEAEESLFSISLKPALDAFVIFPIPERWQLLLKDHFKNARFNSLSQYTLHEKKKSDSTGLQLHLVNLPHLMTLSLMENDRFLSHHVFEYETAEQMIYKIALLLQEKEIAQEQIQLSIEGIAPFWNNLLEVLAQHFPLEKEEMDSKTLTLNFIKTLYQCV